MEVAAITTWLSSFMKPECGQQSRHMEVEADLHVETSEFLSDQIASVRLEPARSGVA